MFALYVINNNKMKNRPEYIKEVLILVIEKKNFFLSITYKITLFEMSKTCSEKYVCFLFFKGVGNTTQVNV